MSSQKEKRWKKSCGNNSFPPLRSAPLRSRSLLLIFVPLVPFVVNAFHAPQQIRKLLSSFWPPTLLTSYPNNVHMIPNGDRGSNHQTSICRLRVTNDQKLKSM